MNAVEFLNSELVTRGVSATIISDSGWSDGVSGGRCITDYKRQIKFSRELSSEELSIVKKIMEEKDCPGWTGVSGYLKGKESLLYQFSTTWDSSD